MPTTHYAFRALPFEQQIVLVWDERQHVATRYEEVDTVAPYYMGGASFVELFYNPIYNVLQDRLRTFVSTALLEPYASVVNLDDLALE
ncbi:hypothetical protein MTX78_20830 [Hymenobacter tibetensis]|uniref:Uncharacterized protein n=1 Tax=Hymenobacter tibetensis TaxID=497967 RepID=A0ABY4CZG5_9BACT|nr:hypothetical protein [Hymenobacter tibetensis]UOG74550.1 hypothetical protein MTX78_20830 [Hymenobacter tibetensis]